MQNPREISFPSWNGKGIQQKTRWQTRTSRVKNGGERSVFRQQSRDEQPCTAEVRIREKSNGAPSTRDRGNLFPGGTRRQYSVQSPEPLRTVSGGGERPGFRVELRIFVGVQLNSAELQPLVCLLEARGQGLMRSAMDGEKMRTSTNMRDLLLALASGRAETDSIGQREGWSESIREEMIDRLQTMVRVPLQKGGDLIMSSIPVSWRDRCAQRVRKASGIIGLITPAVTIKDWSFKMLARPPRSTVVYA